MALKSGGEPVLSFFICWNQHRFYVNLIDITVFIGNAAVDILLFLFFQLGKKSTITGILKLNYSQIEKNESIWRNKAIFDKFTGSFVINIKQMHAYLL